MKRSLLYVSELWLKGLVDLKEHGFNMNRMEPAQNNFVLLTIPSIYNLVRQLSPENKPISCAFVRKSIFCMMVDNGQTKILVLTQNFLLQSWVLAAILDFDIHEWISALVVNYIPKKHDKHNICKYQ